MLAEFLKLPEQAFQRWPTVEINNDTQCVWQRPNHGTDMY